MSIEMFDQHTTELTVIQRAAVALGSDRARSELAALVKKSASIREVKNTAGREECHGAAMVLVKARTTIQKTGKAARDDATQFSKAVIAEEKELIAITQGEEDRLLALRNAWDEARAAERAEAERIERARIEAITLRIADIRECSVLASQCRTAADADWMIQKLASNPLEGFEEFSEEAAVARSKSLARMMEIANEKRDQEAEAARAKAEREAEVQRLADERAELARQRDEQAERDRVAKVEAAAAQKALDDARKAQEAEMQRQRAELAAEQAAARAQLQADLQRMAAERDALMREQMTLRQAEADRVAAEARLLEAAAVREIAPIAESDPIFEQRDGGELLDAQRTYPNGAPMYSTTVFKDNGQPIMLDENGARSVFCDIADDPTDSLEGPSDGEIIAAAVTAVADIFCCTPKAALNRLAEIEDWITAEVTA